MYINTQIRETGRINLRREKNSNQQEGNLKILCNYKKTNLKLPILMIKLKAAIIREKISMTQTIQMMTTKMKELIQHKKD